MNRNELLSAVQHELAKTIEPMISEYIHNHPEYFQNCAHSSGFITNVEITLSYQPENLNKAATVKPCIFTRIGNNKYGSECNRFSHHPEHLNYTTWIDDGIATDYQEDF